MNELLLSSLTPPLNLIAGNYSNMAPSPTARSGEVIALFEGGIYVWGGSYGALNNTMERYDIASNTWSSVAPANSAPTPRHNPGHCFLDGKLYIFGGSTGVNWGPMTNEAWSYDFATKIWTKLANYPVSLALVSAAAVNGKIYLFGGFTGTGASSPFHEYDPVANTYRTITHSQYARYGQRAVGYGGKFYIFGGSIGSSTVLDTLSYDPSNNTWATLKQNSYGRPHAYLSIIDHLVYVYAGRQGNEAGPINKLMRYNIQTGNWTELPAGGVPNYMGACVATQNAIYAVGGYDLPSGQSSTNLVKIT